LIKENKVLLKGPVFLPTIIEIQLEVISTFAILKTNWVYIRLLLNANGILSLENLPDVHTGYVLILIESMSMAGPNEVPFTIKNGKANPDIINVHFNNIQLSGRIMNPGGTPVTEGYLYISDSRNNRIYYAELRKQTILLMLEALATAHIQ
jgi:hypothetical protein